MTHEAGDPTGGSPPPPGPQPTGKPTLLQPAQGARVGRMIRSTLTILNSHHRLVSAVVAIVSAVVAIVGVLATLFGLYLTSQADMRVAEAKIIEAQAATTMAEAETTKAEAGAKAETIRAEVERLRAVFEQISVAKELLPQYGEALVYQLLQSVGIEPPMSSALEVCSEHRMRGSIHQKPIVVSARAGGFAVKRDGKSEIYIHDDPEVRNLYFLIDQIEWKAEHEQTDLQPLMLCAEKTTDRRIGELPVDRECKWIAPEGLSAVYLYNPNNVAVRQARIVVFEQKDWPDPYRHGSTYWLSADPQSDAHIVEIGDKRGVMPDPADFRFFYKHSADISPVIYVNRVNDSDKQYPRPLEVRGGWMGLADAPLATIKVQEGVHVRVEEPLKLGQRLYLHNPNDVAIRLEIAVLTRDPIEGSRLRP